MDIRWTSHLADQAEKERFANYVWTNKPVLKRLKELLEEKETAIDNDERSISSYENQNWAYRQAHRNGSREMIRFLKTLVDLDQQKEPNT